MSLLIAPGIASASSISPVPPPTSGGGACPSSPIFSGTVGEGGDLVGLWQQDPIFGGICPVLQGSSVMGNQLIVGLYTPTTPTGSAMPITVEEYSYSTKTVTHGNTTVTVPVFSNVQWSNTTVPATAGQVQEFQLTVPPAFSQMNLTISLAGVTFLLQELTPGSYLPVPTNYGGVVLLVTGTIVAAFAAFALAALTARWIVTRIRHVPSLRVFGMAAAVAGFLFYLWVQSNPYGFLIWVGKTTYLVALLPMFFISLLFWVAVLPQKAALWGILSPVPEIRNEKPSVGLELIRVYEDRDGKLEYMSNRLKDAIARFVGLRTYVEVKGVTDFPHIIRNTKFEDPRHDIQNFIVTTGPVDGVEPVRIVKPRVIWFPWRKSVREREAKEREGRRGVVS